MERDILQYSLFNVRPRVAAFADAEQRRWGSAPPGLRAAALCPPRSNLKPHLPRQPPMAPFCLPAFLPALAARRYTLQDWPGGEPGEGAAWSTYRGPSLAAVLPDHPGPVQLAAVDVPGLPEQRPLLVAGDVLYFRLADRSSEEYAGARLQQGSRLCSRERPAGCCLGSQPGRGLIRCRAAARLLAAAAAAAPLPAGHLLAADGSRCLVLMPPGWWHRLQELQQAAQAAAAAGAAPGPPQPPLAHVRLSFDRTLLSRMHAALERAARLAPARAFFPPASLGPLRGHMLAEDTYPARVAQAAGSMVELGGTKLNQEQKLAIAAVLCGQLAGMAPAGWLAGWLAAALGGPPAMAARLTAGRDAALQAATAGRSHSRCTVRQAPARQLPWWSARCRWGSQRAAPAGDSARCSR